MSASPSGARNGASMNVRQQLDELREAGYRIRVRHLRVWIPKTPRPGRKLVFFWRRPGEAVNFKPVLATYNDRPLSFTIPAVLSRYGGRTEVEILHGEDPEPIVIGVARCKESDVFV